MTDKAPRPREEIVHDLAECAASQAELLFELLDEVLVQTRDYPWKNEWNNIIARWNELQEEYQSHD